MSKKKPNFFPTLVFLFVAFLLYRYAERWLRALLLYLSAAPWARTLVTGFPPAWRVASRFVAGETIADAMSVVQELNQKGLLATMDYLGESVTDPHEARAACNEILDLLDAIEATGVAAGVSVKLSQLGVKIDRELAVQNMRAILERAQEYNNFVRIDMEESALTNTTLEIFRTLRDKFGFTNTGVVIQAYLYRSKDDIQQLVTEGASVRLCKGAYMEPPELAFPDKADTDKSFVHLMQKLLSKEARQSGVFPAIATHDEEMIQATTDYIRAHDIPLNSFEFQMLFGIRRDRQESLVGDGYRVRVYVPYGTAWYPYFMRRLAERPANLWFFIRHLVRG